MKYIYNQTWAMYSNRRHIGLPTAQTPRSLTMLGWSNWARRLASCWKSTVMSSVASSCGIRWLISERSAFADRAAAVWWNNFEKGRMDGMRWQIIEEIQLQQKLDLFKVLLSWQRKNGTLWTHRRTNKAAPRGALFQTMFNLLDLEHFDSNRGKLLARH